MNIGVLTFYREINFGANLQALSTFHYLKKKGHNPIFIHYFSMGKEAKYAPMFEEVQPNCHREFVDSFITNQTPVCHNSDDINNVIKDYCIEAIIVGSDAVVQNHPLFSRLHFDKKRILRKTLSFDDTTFPNPFWGEKINKNIKMAMMSVSCQDSDFHRYSNSLVIQMKKALNGFVYLSVRDHWTKNMFEYILDSSTMEVNLTPDPVFNFNENAGELLLTKEEICKKYTLPDIYVLVSLHGQSLSYNTLNELKDGFIDKNIECVALPMPFGVSFKHPFNFEIPIPLSPLDWFALIKYSAGYIGNNMHPIVSCLHNAIPCFSIDNYGTKDFWNRPMKESSSKVLHIMQRFGVQSNLCQVNRGKCNIQAQRIIDGIMTFPKKNVAKIAEEIKLEYNQMMETIINRFRN